MYYLREVDLGKDGSKWEHGYIPLNSAAVALKEHKSPGGGGASTVTKTKYPEIHKGDLSTPDARRSREVSADEFQKIAARGEAKYMARKGKSSPIHPSLSSPDTINHAYTESLKDWGGVTIDSHTGKEYPADADAYALTARPPGMDSVSIPEHPDQATFTRAYQAALTKFHDILSRGGHALGVFHDNDKGEIDIDPVLITHNLKDAEDIGAYTHAVGGAYHFKSGDGYWPPHVKAGK